MLSSPHLKPTELFRLLAHPVRFALLQALYGRTMCVNELQSVLGRRQSYVSKQLILLREAGLVRRHQRGPLVFYSLADPLVKGTLQVMQVLGYRICKETPVVGAGLTLRVQGPILEHHVLEVLRERLQGHPCMIENVIVYAPTLEDVDKRHDGSAVATFTLAPAHPGHATSTCSDLVRKMLESAGCQILCTESLQAHPAGRK